MSLFHSESPKERQHKGVVGSFSVDLIKWEPEDDESASIIAHKFEYEDFPTGSYLIVGASQIAIFINDMATGDSLNEEAGKAQVSIFSGPCKIKLETGDPRFAPFRNLAHKLSDGQSSFHSIVYFINTTYMNELKWGTQQPIVIQDPEEEVNIHVRANGLFGVHLEQVDTSVSTAWARTFLQKIVGTRANYTRSEFIGFMRAKILEYVPDLLGNQMIEHNIGILKISQHLSEFSETIFKALQPHFAEFGLVLDNFSFHSINVPDEDLQAVNEMKIKRKMDQLDAEGNARRMDIESAARSRMREREGYTYQQEKGFDVMNTAAANEGTSSTFMGAGMGLGMGAMVGSGMGAAMGGIAQTTLKDVNLSGMAGSAYGTGVQAAVSAGGASGVPNSTTSCPACKAPNAAGAKFCASCGTKLDVASSASACPQCGFALDSSSKFCPNCGYALQKTCPQCGCDVAAGAHFCMECGQKL
ncbi:SPFH domain-containing protein [Fannyhessea vaginae]|uniref:SPFH domain-containing protein n=1 Tax=Fannyhessea vaginae TaxID=82135 RepID=UPI002889D1E6|nr:SPFH domain-containing protein [Fannyhessea vaginae]